MTSTPICARPGVNQHQLIQAAQRGDRAAIDHIVRRYEPLVRRVVWRMQPPFGCERDDLAQEARIGLLAAIRAWNPARGPFPAFADRCVTNHALLAVQAAARYKHQLLSRAVSFQGEHTDQGDTAGVLATSRTFDSLSASNATTDPESWFVVQEELGRVIRALPTLTRAERLALAGTLSGDSYERVAELLGRTPKAASQAAYRARRKLAAAHSPAA